MTKLLLLWIILVSVWMAGCAPVGDREVDAPGGKVSVPRMRVSVRTVMLEDGTRCAVLLGPNRGAIDCDWKP